MSTAAGLCALSLLTIKCPAQLFLNISDIKGGSTNSALQGWIDTLGMNYGVSRQFSAAGSGGTGSAPPQFGELSVSKPIDKSSPLLFRDAAAGPARDVQLQLYRNSPQFERYYQIHLSDALISAYSVSGSGIGGTENVSFNFDRIEITYTQFNSKDSPQQELSAWYDLATQNGGVTATPVGNTAPEISALSDTNTPEDTPIIIPFTVSDADSPADSLVVSATSDNPALVPDSQITFGGSGSNRTATITPATNGNGSATLTLTVSDGISSSSRAFTLTLDPVNDPPELSAVHGQSTSENSALDVNFTVNDPDNAVDTLLLSASSDNPSLVANDSLVLSGTGTDRTLRITPLMNQSGQANITIIATDGSLTNSTSFLLVVNPASPLAPTGIVLSPAAVPENSPDGTLVGTLAAIDPDSTNHTFTLLDSAGGRFRIQGSQLLVNNSALLDYETSTNHVILVSATDPDGLSFTTNLDVAILNINEPPSFALRDASMIETIGGTNTPITRFQVNDPDSGTNAVSLFLDVVNGTLTILTNPPGTVISGSETAHASITGPIADLNAILSSTDGIVYRADFGTSGQDQLTATLNDNGFTGAGGSNSVYTTLGIRYYWDLYEQWLHQNFTDAELEDSGLRNSLWGPDADPDGDHLSNLQEYAAGTSPHVPNLPLSAALSGPTDQKFLTLSLVQRSDPNLTVQVEVSSELGTTNWSSSPSEVEISSPVDLGNGFERYTFRDLTPGTAISRFMRIRWILQATPPTL